jgi:hypothetical protein
MTAEDPHLSGERLRFEPVTRAANALRTPSAAELDAFAEHVCYEIERTLLQSLDPMIGEARAAWGHRHDALVESTLGHLRALDRFFRHDTAAPSSVSRAARRTLSRGEAIVARHYVPDWPRTGFLDRRDRAAINARLGHLAGRPPPGEQWDVRRMALDLGRTFLEFVDRVDERFRGCFARTRSIVIREIAAIDRGSPGSGA